jgi:radical SAM protein (TIGR01212 family)
VINLDNPFPFSNTNKRYHTYDYYLKSRYGEKTFKVSLDGGFDCPNRDGKVGVGGCTFCTVSGSGEFGGDRIDPLEVQFNKVKDMMHQKWPVAKYIAYFQSFTNTYAPVEKLKQTFEPFIGKENVVAMSIGTRPDCLPDDVLDYLADINKRIDLWVELGLQTTFEKTAKMINRCHSYDVFLKAVADLRARNIKVMVHMINGLPYESEEMMFENIKRVSKLDIQGIKIHSLSVIKNTALERIYLKKPFPIMSKEAYVDLVVRQLEIIPPHIVVARVSGDAKKEDLIVPEWSIKKVALANEIDKLMVLKDTYQGKLI